MKKALLLAVFLVLCFAAVCVAEKEFLLIDGLEGKMSGVPEGTIDFGAGAGSTIEVRASTDIKQSGDQAIQIVYDAVPGGYIWVARGTDLDAKKADWQVKPDDIAWEKYEAISFYMYGTSSNANIAFDIKDNGNEIWRFIVTDDFKGWKQIVCKFDAFYVRDDWQPEVADKNGTIDYPIKSYQFEPLPPAKGTLYFDTVALIEK